MGSKKLKKRIKSKKLGKPVKSRKSRLNGQIDIPNVGECQSLDDFSQIRENYFNHLQNVIKENLESVQTGNSPSGECLERISLELEQQALLACMQSDIYQRIMVKIIHDIRKSTQKMKLHFGIENIISKRIGEGDILTRLKTEGSALGEEVTGTEVYSHIPTISSSWANYGNNFNEWESQNIESDRYDSHLTSVNNFEEDDSFLQSGIVVAGSLTESCEAQDVMQTSYSPINEEQYLSLYQCSDTDYASKVSCNEVDVLNDKLNGVIQNSDKETYYCRNLVTVTTSNSEEVGQTDVRGNVNESEIDDSRLSMSEANSSDKNDPILKSRSQLQKSVEKTLKNLKEINVQKKEERERAQIARILEGDADDTDDSLSDNCDGFSAEQNDEKTESQLLSERVEEMRQIFGMEEDEGERLPKEPPRNQDKGQKSVHKRKIHSPSIWYHERVIQMHRLSLLASEMTTDARNTARRVFLELFDEDSDEENESDFRCENRYLTSCKERISSWVVKYLMPFYHKKRIVGRHAFKSLGHHVSSSIIEQIQYPDEWTVKYFVTKFFPVDKQFSSESDVCWFRIE